MREERLEELRRRASRGELAPEPAGTTEEAPGYHGRPILKPPVWTWEVPLYLFVGGASGMSAVIALAAYVSGTSLLLARAALAVALAGALLSPPLLILDLGRPRRFLNMLRVFKWRSPMSVGVWTLLVFSAAVVAALLLLLGFHAVAEALGATAARSLLVVSLLLAAAAGLLLATYTGVLLGVTANPLWSAHRALLPVHFGVSGLGSAVAVLILIGHRQPPVLSLLLLTAGAEVVLELVNRIPPPGARDRALRAGRSGLLVQAAAILQGPLPLLLAIACWQVGLPWAVPAACFLVGALLSRYGWLAAGRAAALDPRAVLERAG